MNEVWVVTGTPGVGQVDSSVFLLTSVAALSKGTGASLGSVPLVEKGSVEGVVAVPSCVAETRGFWVEHTMSIETMVNALAGVLAPRHPLLALMAARSLSE